MRSAILVFALGCGSSPPPPAASPPPPAASPPLVANTPPPSPLAGEPRCHQAIQHMDDLAVNKTIADPEARQARLQALQQAREAGILAGDRTPDCVKRWTNAVVDCVLAAGDSNAADACVPPESAR
ncbi:MAG TPA: hypothetical protein VGL61_14665 [Kofleriaceae bacterium]|jgi:hypothetical protein